MLRTELIRPLPETLRSHAARYADKTAFCDARRQVTYAELERRTGRIAGHLAGLRLQPGDRAAILLGNRVETVESYLAILRAGAIGVPINPRATEAELAYLLRDSGARVVITDEAHAEQLQGAAAPGTDPRIVVVADGPVEQAADAPVPAGTVSYETLAVTEPATPARDDLPLDAPAWMLYTSGTTGRPKGVLSSQRNCLWSVAACYVPIPDLTADDRVLWPLPLFHSLSHIACVLGVTSVGATARVLDGFAPDEVLRVLREDATTFLAGVPTLYHHLVRAAGRHRVTLPDLRMCLVGGAITTAALRRSFEETFGAPLLDAYGSTETCGSITINWPSGSRVEGSCGLPVPGLGVRLVDPETGVDVAAGEEGEVWVRGPSVMAGYHNQPEATAEVFQDGWYRTGDLARRDEAGYFTITGRIKELIIRGGENIHPGEIEEVLRSCTGVADVAVAGKPHDVLGEVPVAFLVPGPEGLDPEELLAACRRKLSYFKVPEELYEIDRIPRTASGKVTRHVLLDQPARLRAAGGAHHESLFQLDWLPLSSLPVPQTPARRWAVAGPDTFGVVEPLRAQGQHVDVYPDLAALADAVTSGAAVPDVTVLPDAPAGIRVAGPLADEVQRRVDALTAGVHGWLDDERFTGGTLVVLTRGALATGPGDDTTGLTGAPVWGAVRAAQAAHPGRTVLVDLDPDDGTVAGLAHAVFSGEPQVLLRSGVALRPRAARVPATADPGGAPQLGSRDTVLLTGADGTVARTVAHHLATAQRVRAFLLVSDQGGADPAAAALRDELAGQGADVALEACDIADRAALEAVLAGRAKRPTAVVLAPGDARRPLRWVVDGALHLHELTADFELTAFVLLGSVAGVLGGPGHGETAAADAFLEALAQHRAARELPALCLSLGPTEQHEGAPGAGLGRLTDREIAAMLDAAQLTDRSHLIALRLDATAADSAAIPPALRDLVDVPVQSVTPDDATSTALRRRLDPLPADERHRVLTDLVRTAVAELYDTPESSPVPADTAFRDLGLDSARAVRLRNALAARTGLDLPVTLAFDHPTPAEVARRLHTLLMGEPAAGQAAPPVAARSDEPIAIVSMGCRLPGGVTSPQDLWRLVSEGADAIGGFPDDRDWNLADLFDPDPAKSGTCYVREGGFLYDAADFDAAFFGISPREALAMDPQQRLLLEVSWETLERAGIDPTTLRGTEVGVFSGLMYHDYATDLGQVPEDLEGYLGTGSSGSVASGRVSYTLGLRGPAVTVDTACSSSLVAVHLAARALRDGECDLALAGGVAVMTRPTSFVEFSRQRALAPDARCKSFAEGADGTAWSEGVGVLLLERLSDARRHGHEVLAVLRGSAVNQDGASNGLTAPSGPAQEEVIRRALAAARLSPADVDAVEGHGTGTTLGDPIEARALLATYGQGRPADQPLWLGSLKSNIGHAQAAAGVAGVIKMVEAMRHGVLPATLHVDRPTSEVDWDGSGLRLLTEHRPWPEVDRPRRAAVSSFGVSGTNAHVILEGVAAEPAVPEASDVPTAPAAATKAVPWIVSGRSATALRAQAERLAAFVEARPDLDPAAVAHTLATSRAALQARAVLVASERADALAGLVALAEGGESPGLVTGVADVDGRRVFVFPGQGSQWAGMGRALMETSPVFAERMTEVAEAMAPFVDWSLLDVIQQAPDAPSLERVDVVQPASFAVMVCLARLWESLGVRPDAVLGHSQGEIAAAHVAGALTLRDAAAVVTLRSQAIARGLAGRGGMVSMAVSADAVRDRLPDGVEVAVVNGPGAVVVAGDPAALDELVAEFEAEGVRVRPVRVDFASHSAHVESIKDELAGLLADISPGPVSVPFFSSVDCRWMDGPELDGDYWYRNMRQTVRFADAAAALAADGFGAFVEVSTHPVLVPSLTEVLDESATGPTVVTGTLRRDEGGWDQVLASAGQLHVRGVSVDFGAAFAHTPTVSPAELPTYAFQHQRYWLSPGGTRSDVADAGLDAAGHPMLTARLALGEGGGTVFTGRLTEQSLPWLADHLVGGATLLPATALLDVLLHVGAELGAPVVDEFTLTAPVVVPDGAGVDLQVHVAEADPESNGRRAVRLLTRPGQDAAWTQAGTALLATDRPVDDGPLAGRTGRPPAGATSVDLTACRDRNTTDHGTGCPAVRAVWRSGTHCHAQLELPLDEADTDGYGLHPALFEAALHALGVGGLLSVGEQPALASSWSGVRLHAVGARTLRVVLAETGPDTVALRAFDDHDEPVVEVEAVTVRPVDPHRLAAADTGQAALHEVVWVPAVPDGNADKPADWALHSALTPDAPPPPLVVLQVPDGDPDATVPERVHAVGRDVLHTLQDWLADPRTETSRLVVLARRGDLVHEPVRALVRTAQTENPGRFVLLDTDAADGPGSVPAALAGLPDEPQITVRDGQRLVARLKRAEQQAPAEPTRLTGGTVLVTGANGGLGRLVVRHLAEVHRVAELVLLSRSPISPELVEDLLVAGVRVRTEAVDTGDRDALAPIVESLADRLTAVVHVAGVVADGVIGALDDAMWASTLRPKVDAGWHLHELTAHLDLAAFVLYSSVAGVFGGAGQGNYAAGNAFLDALAAHRRSLGLPAVSLAWGMWAEATGITGRLGEADLARIARTGTRPLSAEQGLALFDAALDHERAALVPIRLDLASARPEDLSPLLRDEAPVRPRRTVRRAVSSGAASAEGADGAAPTARLAALSGPERDDLLRTLVRDTTATVLGHASAADVDERSPFKDLGIDSLTAVELRNRLTSATGLRLPSTVVYNHPTPARLAAHLAEQFGDEQPQAEPAPAPVAAPGGAPDEPIAVVAMGCRFPGGLNSAEDLWRFLMEENDAIGDLPTDRGWEGLVEYDPNPDVPGKIYVRSGGFLSNVADFDAAFFRITPSEAVAMDPQQRLLLEVTWETLERAGIDPTTLRATPTGVYVGTQGQDYATGSASSQTEEGYLVTGRAGSVLSGRLAYTLGLEGPAVSVDTACSSALVALHLAVQALRSGDCNLALAGGVSVMSTPEGLIGFSRQRMLARDGRSKAFAEGADGLAMAEGVGMLLLQRLSEARAAGRTVLAVIRSTALNQDGASNGLPAPNGPSQERVIRQALANARLTPAEVDAVEAHGTGTELGDPIEADALRAAYGDRPADRPLWIGSVKSNIGHTLAAAGAAGVIKMVEALRHGTLPKTLHVEQPSSHIDWSAGGIELLTEARPWPETDHPRRAGVSAFGISGTNAHVILEQAPDVPEEPDAIDGRDGAHPAGPAVLPVPLSARSTEGLRAQAAQLADHLADHPELRLPDVAFTQATVRASLERRAVVLAADRAELLTGLTALRRGEPAGPFVSDVVQGGGLAFLFTGQGSQRAGMGDALCADFPAFAEAFDAACAALDRHLEHPLGEVVSGAPRGGLLDRTAYAAPALFAFDTALYRLLESWGVRPDFVVGHSAQEVVAAHVAGVLSLADAAALVAGRARLVQALPENGALLAVQAAEPEVLALLAAESDRRVWVAAVDGPRSVVVSGDEDAVSAFAEQCAEQEWRTRRLRVGHALHSPRMDAVLDEFRTLAAGLSYQRPRIPVLSGSTGELLTAAQLAAPDHWVEQLRRPVRFVDVVRTLGKQGVRTCLELGPDAALTPSVTRALEDAAVPATCLATVRRGRPETRSLLTAVAAAHARGVAVDFAAVFAGTGARRVDLPTYAFQRRRYWLAPAAVTPTGAPDTPHQEPEEKAPEPSFRQRWAELPADERPAACLELVREQVAETLGYLDERLADDAAFFEVGFTSLNAVELRNRLIEQTGLRLPVGLLFDQPTPGMLAEHLQERLDTEREA